MAEMDFVTWSMIIVIKFLGVLIGGAFLIGVLRLIIARLPYFIGWIISKKQQQRDEELEILAERIAEILYQKLREEKKRNEGIGIQEL